MRAKSMILIAIALGCGLVASIGISQVMDARKGNAVEEMEKIFVAKTDVDIAVPLTREMLTFEEWPKGKIPEGAIRKLEDIEGRQPRQRLYEGEPILSKKLIDPNEAAGASTQIPKGYRAFPVKVSAETAGSLILPGDRVDVLVYLRQGEGVTQSSIWTFLRNIRVFAVNEQIDRGTDREGNVIAARTVQLLVTPKQVEKLMLAAKMGQISIAMRRSDADEEDEPLTEGTSIFDVTGRRNDAPPVEPVGTSGKPESLLELIESTNKVSDSPPVTEPARTEPTWTMNVVGPDGIQQFEFGKEGEPPRTTAASGSPTDDEIDSEEEESETDTSEEKTSGEEEEKEEEDDDDLPLSD